MTNEQIIQLFTKQDNATSMKDEGQYFERLKLECTEVSLDQITDCAYYFDWINAVALEIFYESDVDFSQFANEDDEAQFEAMMESDEYQDAFMAAVGGFRLVFIKALTETI